MNDAKKRKRSSAADSPKPKTSVGASASPMNLDLLQQLVQLMSANDLNTVDVRDGNRRVILKRGAVLTAAAAASPPVAYAPAAAPAAPGAGGAGASAAASEDAGLVPIKSPMVGTFYAKPNPESKPFVHVGTTVDEDTDVCIIEAMKVFNNIKAETRGTIAKILVSDGQSVEFGTVLFLVKP